MSPSSAYRKFIDNFEREREGEEVADRFFVPDYKWVYNFHAQYVKKRFGSMDGVDVYLKLVRNIKDYNERVERNWLKLRKLILGKPSLLFAIALIRESMITFLQRNSKPEGYGKQAGAKLCQTQD